MFSRFSRFKAKNGRHGRGHSSRLLALVLATLMLLGTLPALTANASSQAQADSTDLIVRLYGGVYGEGQEFTGAAGTLSAIFTANNPVSATAVEIVSGKPTAADWSQLVTRFTYGTGATNRATPAALIVRAGVDASLNTSTMQNLAMAERLDYYPSGSFAYNVGSPAYNPGPLEVWAPNVTSIASTYPMMSQTTAMYLPQVTAINDSYYQSTTKVAHLILPRATTNGTGNSAASVPTWFTLWLPQSAYDSFVAGGTISGGLRRGVYPARAFPDRLLDGDPDREIMNIVNWALDSIGEAKSLTSSDVPIVGLAESLVPALPSHLRDAVPGN